jgi:hypothetical protein
MIIVVRSMTVLPGKTAAGVASAQEIARLVRQAGIKRAHALAPVGGNSSRLGVLLEYESLAQYDNLHFQLITDPAWAALSARDADILAPGSLRQKIWRVI